MNPSNDDRIYNLLRSSMPPIGEADVPRDLWPEMLRRIENGMEPEIRFGLLDWLIAVLAIAYLIVFPNLIPNLLYHL